MVATVPVFVGRLEPITAIGAESGCRTVPPPAYRADRAAHWFAAWGIYLSRRRMRIRGRGRSHQLDSALRPNLGRIAVQGRTANVADSCAVGVHFSAYRTNKGHISNLYVRSATFVAGIRDHGSLDRDNYVLWITFYARLPCLVSNPAFVLAFVLRSVALLRFRAILRRCAPAWPLRPELLLPAQFRLL